MKKIVLSSTLILVLCFSAGGAFAGGRDNRCGNSRSSHYGGTSIRFSTGPSFGYFGSHFNVGSSHRYTDRSCDRYGSRPSPACQSHNNRYDVDRYGNRPSPACQSHNNRYDVDRYGNRIIARNERGYWTQGEFYHHGYYKPPVYHPYERGDRRHQP